MEYGFCSNDIRIETMHDRFVQGNQEQRSKTWPSDQFQKNCQEKDLGIHRP